jgi:hypothetical protein
MTANLAPYNLISSWYWVYGEPARPVRLQDLEAVWLDGDDYAAEIVTLFDGDGDGRLSPTELRIDSDAKEPWSATASPPSVWTTRASLRKPAPTPSTIWSPTVNSPPATAPAAMAANPT